MKTYVFLVEYDGTDFAGFQIQKIQPTIQCELEKALKVILREDIKIHCCGRTDAGVHATGQVVHFETSKHGLEVKSIIQSMNALLPETIAIRQFSKIQNGFHARFSCLAREYEYLIWNDSSRNALCTNRYLWHKKKINVEILNDEIKNILGEHNFTSFSRLQEEQKTYKRYIDLATAEQVYDPLSDTKNIVSIRIRANAFLHNMIRIIVGSLLDIHDSRVLYSMKKLISLQDRKCAGKTVVPTGLYFRKAYYLQKYNNIPWLNTLESYPWMKQDTIEAQNTGILDL